MLTSVMCSSSDDKGGNVLCDKPKRFLFSPSILLTLLLSRLLFKTVIDTLFYLMDASKDNNMAYSSRHVDSNEERSWNSLDDGIGAELDSMFSDIDLKV